MVPFSVCGPCGRGNPNSHLMTVRHLCAAALGTCFVRTAAVRPPTELQVVAQE